MRGANAGNLVGRDRHAHPGTADQNAPRSFASHDRFAHPLGKIGIVILGLVL